MEDRFSTNRRVRSIIKENDKKSTAVADRAGIRRDTFSRIINCKRPLYADEILPICKALGVSVSELYAEE